MTAEEVNQDTPEPSAGQQLRRAREAAGLSLADIAKSQHLRPAIIQAIENGDYGQIDSELFLKGYVRVYAGQVGLDPDPVIACLDRELEPLRQQQEAAREENPLITIDRRKRYKKRVARTVTALVLLVVVVVGVSYYLLGEDRLSPTTVENGTEAGTSTGNAAVSGPEIMEPSGEAVTSSPSGPATTTALAQQPDAGSGQAGAGSASEDAVGQTGPDDETVTNTDGIEVRPLAEPESASATTAPYTPEDGNLREESDAPGEAPLVPADAVATADADGPVSGTGLPVDAPRLTASFVDDCWVQVIDSEGRTLVAELKRAGDTMNVTGATPLRVIFGAVDAVGSVEFAGEAVDISSYPSRDNRVAFTLNR